MPAVGRLQEMINPLLTPETEKPGKDAVEITLKDRMRVRSPSAVFRCSAKKEQFAGTRPHFRFTAKRTADRFDFQIPFFPKL